MFVDSLFSNLIQRLRRKRRKRKKKKRRKILRRCDKSVCLLLQLKVNYYCFLVAK